jgi:hypothetical protein
MLTLTKVTVAVSNAPQALANSATPVCKVIIQAKAGNSASVFVGPSNVSSTNKTGYELVTPPAASVNFPFVLEGKAGNDIDISQLYVVGTSGDIVNMLTYTY